MADYNREQLVAALRKADAAGDTAAARAIARRIKGMEAPQAAPKTVEELTPGISTNPTDGMSTGQRFMAGAAKSASDTVRGVRQFAAEAGQYNPYILAADAVTGGRVSQQLGMPQDAARLRQESDAVAERDAPLTDTGAGFAGNVTGLVAQVLAPGAALSAASRVPQFAGQARNLSGLSRLFMPTSLKAGAAQGGALGAVQAVGEEDNRGLNTLIGTAGGFVGGLLPRVVGSGVRALNRLREPLTTRGLENIAGRTLQRFATNPQLQQLADPILGRAPTLAEATLDPGIAQLQRAAVSKSPEVASALFNARVAANEARTGAIERFAGTPAAREAAMQGVNRAEDAAYAALRDVDGVDVVPVVRRVDRLISGPEGKRPEVRAALNRARAMFFEPYEDAARIKDARKIVADAVGRRMSSADTDALLEARRILANRQGLSADEVVEQLSSIRPQSKTAAAALKEATELVNSLNVAYESQVPRLIGVRKGINDLIAGKGDSKAGTAAQAELIEIRNALDDAIRKVAPGIDAALDARRVGMRPVNEMDTMTELLQRATVPVPTQSGGLSRGLQPSAFLRPTEDLDALARRGTGFRKATGDGTLSDAAQETIEGVRIGLARQQFADSAGKVAGSPTAQFLAGQNIMDGILGQPRGGLTTGLANLGAAALDKPYAFVGVPERLNAVMARVLTDPIEAQRVLSRLPAPDRAIIEQAIGRISAPAGSAAASGQGR